MQNIKEHSKVLAQVYEAWCVTDCGAQYRGLWTTQEDAERIANGSVGLSSMGIYALASQVPERVNHLKEGESDVYARSVVECILPGAASLWSVEGVLRPGSRIAESLSEVFLGDQSVLCVDSEAAQQLILLAKEKAIHLATLPLDGRILAPNEYCFMPRYAMRLPR